MGYFSKQVGRAVVASKAPILHGKPLSGRDVVKPHFAAQVGKAPVMESVTVIGRCPRCHGKLAVDNGFMRCSGRCGRRWVAGGRGRWLDPAILPFGACSCCCSRVALVAADVGAICPSSHTEYLILPEGVRPRAEVAPLGICLCCLPPQPLVEIANGLVCRNKPQQHYQVKGEGKGEVVWLGSAPVLDQAEVTAAIDAALCANSAELTLFGLFTSPTGYSG